MLLVLTVTEDRSAGVVDLSLGGSWQRSKDHVHSFSGDITCRTWILLQYLITSISTCYDSIPSASLRRAKCACSSSASFPSVSAIIVHTNE